MIKVVTTTPGVQPIHHGVGVLKELRSAGIPAVGSLWPVCAEHGWLTCYDVGGDLVYEWEPDPNHVEELF